MKKLAFLIAGVDKRAETNHVVNQGVRMIAKDINIILQEEIQRIAKFLMTSIGGNWANSEIVQIHNQINSEFCLNEFILQNAIGKDYILLYYVGHGSLDSNDYESMQYFLADNQTPKDLFIQEIVDIFCQQEIKKYLIFHDACRSINFKMPLEFTVQVADIDDLPGSLPKNLEFEQAISSSSVSNSIVFSTSKNEGALFKNEGNLFTENLLDSIIKWNFENKEKGKVLTISEAISLSNKKIFPNQVAEVQPDNSDLPIAIS